jgi:hypothetical protein
MARAKIGTAFSLPVFSVPSVFSVLKVLPYTGKNL